MQMQQIKLTPCMEQPHFSVLHVITSVPIGPLPCMLSFPTGDIVHAGGSLMEPISGIALHPITVDLVMKAAVIGVSSSTR